MLLKPKPSASARLRRDDETVAAYYGGKLTRDG
jgi:hypothetical protein